MSFLDVVSCGFGAIILLFVITKIGEPQVVEKARADLSAVVAELEARRGEVKAQAVARQRVLQAKQADLESALEQARMARRALAVARSALAESSQALTVKEKIEDKLASAQQSLTAEMRSLLAGRRRAKNDATIGGVPVDSEYIIFVIDTSGSMQNFAWPLMLRKFKETLDIYPGVKGIQVMNDMGDYMFPGFAGRWIPDSPARRRDMIKRLRTWNPFSNSSPVEGITAAVRTFYAKDKKISIYVFGDEFSSGSLESVVDEVDAINRVGADGKRLVRIHTVAFPVQITRADQVTGIRFAALMRELSRRNDGTFVGLNSYQPVPRARRR